ncbi:MAG: hypothetical protein ACKVQC_02350 [Elusimicrobiota bacterium]
MLPIHKKNTCIFLLITFLSQVVLSPWAEASFWQERKEALPSKSILFLPQFPLSSGEIRSRFSFESIKKWGSVREVHLSNAVSKKWVLHIQDIHKNFEAQNQIANLLENYFKTRNQPVVYVEGSEGILDLTGFFDFPSHKALRDVSEYLLKTNEISGPVKAALSSAPFKPALMGIDDEKLHFENVSAYLRSQKEKKMLLQEISLKNKTLLIQKENNNPKLNCYLNLFDQYYSGNINLGDLLLKLPHLSSISTHLTYQQKKELRNFTSAVQLEKERDLFLKALLAHKRKSFEIDLVKLTQELKSGHLPQNEFYALVIERYKNEVNLNQFLEFKKFYDYLTFSEKLNAQQLLQGFEILIDDVLLSAITSNKERKFIADWRGLKYLEKLTEFSLTRYEWEKYESTTHSFSLNMKELLNPFHEFYRLAIKRDKKMAENFIEDVRSKKSNEVLNADVKNPETFFSAVLVTGGFHSSGISEQLTKQGYNVVSFTPRVTKIKSENYLSDFEQQKTPLDILFEGQKLFLADHAFSKINQGKAVLLVSAWSIIKKLASLEAITAWLEKTTHWNPILISKLGSYTVRIKPMDQKFFFQVGFTNGVLSEKTVYISLDRFVWGWAFVSGFISTLFLKVLTSHESQWIYFLPITMLVFITIFTFKNQNFIVPFLNRPLLEHAGLSNINGRASALLVQNLNLDEKNDPTSALNWINIALASGFVIFISILKLVDPHNIFVSDIRVWFILSVLVLSFILHEGAHWAQMGFGKENLPKRFGKNIAQGGIGVYGSSGWPGVLISGFITLVSFLGLFSYPQYTYYLAPIFIINLIFSISPYDWNHFHFPIRFFKRRKLNPPVESPKFDLTHFSPDLILFSPAVRRLTTEEPNGSIALPSHIADLFGNVNHRDIAWAQIAGSPLMVAHVPHRLHRKSNTANSACPLCSQLQRTQARQVDLGNGFILVPEQFPYFGLTGTIVRKEHQHPQIDINIFRSMLQTLYELGSFGYRIGYNHKGAGMKIIHDSYKVFPQETPIEKAKTNILLKHNGFKISYTVDFPIRSLVIESDKPERILDELVRLEQLLELLEIPFNLLMTQSTDGKVKVFVMLRSQTEFSTSFPNKTFGMVETAGIVLLEKEKDFKSDDLKTKIIQAFSEIGLGKEKFEQLLYVYKAHAVVTQYAISNNYSYQVDKGTGFFVFLIPAVGEVLKYFDSPPSDKNRWGTFFYLGINAAINRLGNLFTPTKLVTISNTGQFSEAPEEPNGDVYVLQKIAAGKRFDNAFDSIVEDPDSLPIELANLFNALTDFYLKTIQAGVLDIDILGWWKNYFIDTNDRVTGFDTSHLRIINTVNALGEGGYLEDFENRLDEIIADTVFRHPRFAGLNRTVLTSLRYKTYKDGAPLKLEDTRGVPMEPWISELERSTQNQPSSLFNLWANSRLTPSYVKKIFKKAPYWKMSIGIFWILFIEIPGMVVLNIYFPGQISACISAIVVALHVVLGLLRADGVRGSPLKETWWHVLVFGSYFIAGALSSFYREYSILLFSAAGLFHLIRDSYVFYQNQFGLINNILEVEKTFQVFSQIPKNNRVGPIVLGLQTILNFPIKPLNIATAFDEASFKSNVFQRFHTWSTLANYQQLSHNKNPDKLVRDSDIIVVHVTSDESKREAIALLENTELLEGKAVIIVGEQKWLTSFGGGGLYSENVGFVFQDQLPVNQEDSMYSYETVLNSASAKKLSKVRDFITSKYRQGKLLVLAQDMVPFTATKDLAERIEVLLNFGKGWGKVLLSDIIRMAKAAARYA